ncbi:hypothetical protein STA3757_33110 [Stanieria sp. NIES-3757]|nr:hypothetical protein STA3757_33110 [Stanieria sp. NIES-3757]
MKVIGIRVLGIGFEALSITKGGNNTLITTDENSKNLTVVNI